jgi:hypothetical protein
MRLLVPLPVRRAWRPSSPAEAGPHNGLLRCPHRHIVTSGLASSPGRIIADQERAGTSNRTGGEMPPSPKHTPARRSERPIGRPARLAVQIEGVLGWGARGPRRRPVGGQPQVAEGRAAAIGPPQRGHSSWRPQVCAGMSDSAAVSTRLTAGSARSNRVTSISGRARVAGYVSRGATTERSPVARS